MYTKYQEKTFGIDRTKLQIFFTVCWVLLVVVHAMMGDFAHAITNLLLAVYGIEVIGLRNHIKAGG